MKKIRILLRTRAIPIVACLISTLGFVPIGDAQIIYNGISRRIGGSDFPVQGGSDLTFESSISATGVYGSISVTQTTMCSQALISGTFVTRIYSSTNDFEEAENYFEAYFTVPEDTSYNVLARSHSVGTNTIGGTRNLAQYWYLDNAFGALDGGDYSGCNCIADRSGVLLSNVMHRLQIYNGGRVMCVTPGPGLFIDTTTRLDFQFSLMPKLSVNMLSSSLVIEWPAYGTHFVLDSTSDLTPPIVWTAVTNATAFTNGSLRVTLDKSTACSFFRLRGT